MAKQQRLEDAITAASSSLDAPHPTILGTRFVGHDEVVISRAHLEALIAAATWRLGYLAAKEERGSHG